MKKFCLILTINIIVVALVLTGWTKPKDKVAVTGITITDEIGREVTLPGKPKRIIVLTGYPSEVICALGEGNKIVGICSPEDQYLPELREKESVGKSTVTPNLEKIAELNPDLIIAYQWTKKEIIDKFHEWKIPVLCFRVWTFDETIQFIEKMGKLLGKEEKAKELNDFIQNKIDLIKERTKNLSPEEKPKIFHEVFETYQSTAEGENAMETPWGIFMYESPMQIQIKQAGGINCVGRQPSRSPKMSPEWLVEKNPDIITKVPMTSEVSGIPDAEGMKKVRDEIMKRRELKEVKAVKEGKVYIIHSKLCAGPRQVIGTCYNAKWFHPELFPDLDPKAVHKEMLKEFWGVKLQGRWAYPEL